MENKSQYINNFLDECNNGNEMYDKSIYFRRSCDAIINGASKYLIIEQLCEIIEKQQKEINEIKLNTTQPIQLKH